MTAATAMKVGQAAGTYFQRGEHRHRVVIGKDTRLSGYMLENAMTAGFTSVGMDVVLLGPMPTPAVALLTREMRADVGVMISASHNPFEDNGIKLFGPDGFKLSDEDELAIEAMLEEELPLAPATDVGRARRIEDARGRYIHAVKASLPHNLRLDGLRIVVDCAHGAAYQVAPSALWELGAEVIAIGVEPNGRNINMGVGSTHLEAIKAKVREVRADVGIALDGDADRLIVVDEKGQTVDGDQIMALIGSQMAKRGALTGGGVVATVMSNLGLERFLRSKGLDLVRTAVGDRHVLEKMREGGYNVGGEQSGHMILTDHATTGDGTIAALQCWPRWCRAASPPARRSTCSIRCPSCSRTCALPGASRSKPKASRPPSPRPRNAWPDTAACHPPFGHRTGDPRHGRRRRRAGSRTGGRRHLRRRPQSRGVILKIRNCRFGSTGPLPTRPPYDSTLWEAGCAEPKFAPRRISTRRAKDKSNAGNAPRLRTLRHRASRRSPRRLHLFDGMHLLRRMRRRPR
jgi:phosphoglucosamine mutase